jgi:hypothetical protein
MSSVVIAGDTSGQITLAATAVAGTNTITLPASTGTAQLIGQGTAVASTSGTSIDFTGIPSWVKRVTVMFNGVSTSGTSLVQMQIGAGSIESTGYTSWASTNTGTNAIAIGSSTTGAHIQSSLAANVINLSMRFELFGSNIWISSHVGNIVSGNVLFGSAIKTLSGTLDRVRITTVNGTDTFDAGSVNILYEG